MATNSADGRGYNAMVVLIIGALMVSATIGLMYITIGYDQE